MGDPLSAGSSYGSNFHRITSDKVKQTIIRSNGDVIFTLCDEDKKYVMKRDVAMEFITTYLERVNK